MLDWRYCGHDTAKHTGYSAGLREIGQRNRPEVNACRIAALLKDLPNSEVDFTLPVSSRQDQQLRLV